MTMMAKWETQIYLGNEQSKVYQGNAVINVKSQSDLHIFRLHFSCILPRIFEALRRVLHSHFSKTETKFRELFRTLSPKSNQKLDWFLGSSKMIQ